MLYLTPLIILTVLLAIFAEWFFSRLWIEEKRHLDWLNYELKKAGEEEGQLEETNSGLLHFIEEATALYDITKDLCKTLDEKEILTIFKEHAGRFISMDDCNFIKSGEELVRYNGYSVLPLKINNGIIGYLVASGIRQADTDKFNILTKQFLIGIKRSLLYQKIQELAITDTLTQAYSRRYFIERLKEEVERSGKFKYGLAFLMVDIDNFKDYNSQYGHLAGDAILREIARIIKENIRQIDFMGRYGGEELSIVLTETEKTQASLIAERIRQTIDSKTLNIYDENLRVTISIGLSAFQQDASDVEGLIDKADKALYRAKENGRNRVCVFNGT